MRKKIPKQAKFSPQKYIREKGRSYSIFQCLIADGFEDMGLTVALIVRQQPSDKFMITNLLLDRHCLGIKNVFCNCNLDKTQLDELIQQMEEVGQVAEVDAIYFHNLIYATIDFAEDNGFHPPKDFSLAERILDPDLIDDGIDKIEVGVNGKPMFINGPYDNVDHILSSLDKNVGKGNYETTINFF